MPSPASPLKVAVLGFGTVGSSVARILVDRQPQGLVLTHIYNRNIARKKKDWVPSTVCWTEDIETILSSDADVIVELMGGLDPVAGWVERALASGKSVVTANKKLIATQGIALEKLARSKGAHLLYGAAVAGGIPVIPGLQQGLAGDQVLRIEGILNGTCNFILSKMEQGAEYADVLKEAQELGYAEADPTEDVDGFDARAKLVILSRLALRADLDPSEIPCRSIRAVSAIDFAYAKELDCTIRQISRAEIRGEDLASGDVLASVGPMLVPKASPLAWSHGTENTVLVGGKYGGDVVFSGHGAGGHPTAVAVVSDLISMAHGSRAVDLPSRKTALGGEFLLRHSIRFVVDDRPGIIAEIAQALAVEGINIHAIFQKPGFETSNLPFVVTVEPCTSSCLRRALDRIETMSCLLEKPFALQILEPEG
ncbi:homoserine dehydrogenase [Silvibacterium dinghuense]|uniref:Homoserine dehydrogenase n=1 Tax=Silvibacterium dinghuense TaxID=1560006 RepID=A0A4Q1SEZ7_9BACT|nr:homoserine dehydrogenase [Silvibacterium dinghuense]RXS95488.1 homoserine dehydrogenase [Silvibacterium dinghuense]GGH13504.1 homoserine dehydrogenase [Silvibacterium dinghuense]